MCPVLGKIPHVLLLDLKALKCPRMLLQSISLFHVISYKINSVYSYVPVVWLATRLIAMLFAVLCSWYHLPLLDLCSKLPQIMAFLLWIPSNQKSPFSLLRLVKVSMISRHLISFPSSQYLTVKLGLIESTLTLMLLSSFLFLSDMPWDNKLTTTQSTVCILSDPDPSNVLLFHYPYLLVPNLYWRELSKINLSIHDYLPWWGTVMFFWDLKPNWDLCSYLASDFFQLSIWCMMMNVTNIHSSSWQQCSFKRWPVEPTLLQKLPSIEPSLAQTLHVPSSNWTSSISY